MFFLLYILGIKNVEWMKNVECRMKIKEWRIKMPFPLLQEKTYHLHPISYNSYVILHSLYEDCRLYEECWIKNVECEM